MSLVNELQEVAETADILTVLRKAKRVSGKLNRNDMLERINNELNGYSGEVPTYRMAKSDLYYKTNGYVPAGWGYLKHGIESLPEFGLNGMPEEIRESIVDLQTVVDSGVGLRYALPSNIEKRVRSYLSEDYKNVSLFMLVGKPEIQRIVQAVRDVILDWAIRLEQEGVIGEGKSFTDEEKKKSTEMKIDIFAPTFGDNAVLGAVGRLAEGKVIR